MAFDVQEILRMLREELQRVTAAIAAMEKLLESDGRDQHRTRNQRSMSSGNH
jgi:hypothetical protein